MLNNMTNKISIIILIKILWDLNFVISVASHCPNQLQDPIIRYINKQIDLEDDHLDHFPRITIYFIDN